MRKFYGDVATTARGLLLALGFEPDEDLSRDLPKLWQFRDIRLTSPDDLGHVQGMPGIQHLWNGRVGSEPLVAVEIARNAIPDCMFSPVIAQYEELPVEMSAAHDQEHLRVAQHYVRLLLNMAPHAIALIQALADDGKMRWAMKTKGAGRREHVLASRLFEGFSASHYQLFGSWPDLHAGKVFNNGTRTKRNWDGSGVTWARSVIELAASRVSHPHPFSAALAVLKGYTNFQVGDRLERGTKMVQARRQDRGQ